MSLKGLLITNCLLNQEKYRELSDFLIDAAKHQDVRLIEMTNKELIEALPADFEECKGFFQKNSIDFVLFWDKDIRLASLIEKCGLRVFNSSLAIDCCDDKSLTYISLLGSGIKMPETVLCPKLFFKTDIDMLEFCDSLIKKLSLPIVIKECYGSFGAQVYLADSREQLLEIIDEKSPSPMIFQRFIDCGGGRDIRIHVVGGHVVTAMKRQNDNDFRANISGGGYMTPYCPTKEQCELAISSCSALGLDFAGVDILVSKEGENYLCEINSNAHFINILKCTGVNVAECIIAYIKECLVL